MEAGGIASGCYCWEEGIGRDREEEGWLIEI